MFHSEDNFRAKARWETSWIRSSWTYAPVINPTTTCLPGRRRLGIFDSTDKPVYMYQPIGFEKGEKETLVCELIQSLYGLTPSARIWYDTLAAVTKEVGFRTSNCDAGLYGYTYPGKIYTSPLMSMTSRSYVRTLRRKSGSWIK